MNVKKVLTALLISTVVFFITSCTNERTEDNRICITFMLEGGKYRNSEAAVKNYYDFEEGTSNLIHELNHFTKEEIVRANYNLVGWFKNKTETGEYTDQWNFETDRVTESITLYAYWKPNIVYTYDVGYLDDDNNFVSLGTYEVDKGDFLDDYEALYNKRFGYTLVGTYDEEGNPWDEFYEHPGGDTSTTIRVIYKFIEGDYKVVSTAQELKMYKNQNIYLLNDIDLKGDKLSFGDYKGHFEGNGHTISNFELDYIQQKQDLKPDLEDSNLSSVYISLFGMANNALINNVKFENVKVNVNVSLTTVHKVYFAPLCITSSNSTFNNVELHYEIVSENFFDGFNTETNYIKTEHEYYTKDENSSFNNCVVELITKND